MTQNSHAAIQVPAPGPKAVQRQRQALRVKRCNRQFRVPSGELFKCQDESGHGGACGEQGIVRYDNGTAAEYSIRWHDLGLHELRNHPKRS